MVNSKSSKHTLRKEPDSMSMMIDNTSFVPAALVDSGAVVIPSRSVPADWQ